MKLIDEKIVFKNKWLEIYSKTYRLKNGQEDDFYVIGKNRAVAAVLAVDSNNMVTLVKQFRWAVNAETIDLPGGNVDSGETPLEAAKRELEEEVGITARTWNLLCKRYLDSGQKDCVQYIFLATNLKKTETSTTAEPFENIKLVRTKIDTLSEEIYSSDNIIESSLVIGLSAYEHRTTKS